jgi:hypothetical protein
MTATMLRHLLSALLLGIALWLAGPAGVGPAVSYAQACLSQSQTQALVASGQVNPFSVYYGSLQQQGQVVSSCLIQNGGGYAYLVKVVKANGQVVTVTVP